VQQLRDILEAIYELEATEDHATAALHAAPRSRGKRSQSHSTDAATIWEAVLDGAWSLVEQVDSDGYRCFLARRNEHDVAPALSERERQIVAHASVGHSNKHIAYELGLCSSTVAAQLTSAARKLGVSSREALLHAFAVLGGSAVDRAAPGDHGAAPERGDRHEGTSIVRVARFRQDGHDYAVIRIAIVPKLPPSLTTAETEVATLVIEGLSNAAIAARRTTSVRTVANQLRSIYSKLAVGSRRQLCSRFSIQRDLGPRAIVDHRAGHHLAAFAATDVNYPE
jgi:DNA-binding NarL/FixJ family response regulator